jgi:hypothetical protein
MPPEWRRTFPTRPLTTGCTRDDLAVAPAHGTLERLATRPGPRAEPARPDVTEAMLERIVERVVRRALGGRRSDGIDPPVVSPLVDDGLVFVIIPFRASMEPVVEAIKEAATKNGLRAELADSTHPDYRITDTIFHMIRKARFIVADLTHESQNVYFELGAARMLDKTVITIAKQGTRVHVDARDWNVIEYIDSRPLEVMLSGHFGSLLGRTARGPG